MNIEPLVELKFGDKMVFSLLQYPNMILERHQQKIVHNTIQDI